MSDKAPVHNLHVKEIEKRRKAKCNKAPKYSKKGA
jgi:hypothetical protein